MTHLDLYSIKKLSKILNLHIPKKDSIFWRKNYEHAYIPNMSNIFFSDSYYERVRNLNKYGCVIYELNNILNDILKRNVQISLSKWNTIHQPYFMIYILSPNKRKTISFNVMMFETLYSLFTRLYVEYPDWFDFEQNIYFMHQSHHKIYMYNDFNRSLLDLSFQNGKLYQVGYTRTDNAHKHEQYAKIKLLSLGRLN